MDRDAATIDASSTAPAASRRRSVCARIADVAGTTFILFMQKHKSAYAGEPAFEAVSRRGSINR